ncbi:LuxR C-terminal-related transcriptional regulator [Pseudarthrobacter enclensis]|uniref:LuxR C-terminal-related transcriptional regulator n=1 Tax=Pseudarthrobacter enclensis TaxID=993070 RepID=UPI00343808F5
MTSQQPQPHEAVPHLDVQPHGASPDHPDARLHPAEVFAAQLKGENAVVRELLLALSVGFVLPGPLPADLQRKLDSGQIESLDTLIPRVEQGGLLVDGMVTNPVRHALLVAAPSAKVHALQRELVDQYANSGQPLGEFARELASFGLVDGRVAACLEQMADKALHQNPGLASQLYGEALQAGADEIGTAARRAQAHAADGDLDAATRAIETLLASAEPADIRRGIDVAAAVWAQRGMLARSAESYRWLGPSRVGASAPMAAVAMIGSGDRAGADALFSFDTMPALPTLLGTSLAEAGRGILLSLSNAPQRALTVLIHASDMLNAAKKALPLPDTPAALAALIALQSGEPQVAQAVCRAATAAGQGGDAAAPRLHLLQAWSAMQMDNLEDARLAINEASKANHWPLVPRDQFLRAALEVGLARRSGDLPELLMAWERAREAMLHTSVDLYNLLPWGELIITAARLRESSRVARYMEEAGQLLDRLGNPVLWSVPFHWAATQAALLRERPADLAPHAAALARAARESQFAGVLARAGKAWVSVLAGDFDAAAVEAAARGLGRVGMPWEGARLAGHAAAGAAERKDMMRLLSCARDLHPQEHSNPTGSPGSDGATPSAVPKASGNGTHVNGSNLSEREKEVARLVLEGKTYREIGETIYISPRTAEHHIARMRRRLGAENRADLLARLRIALSVENPSQD